MNSWAHRCGGRTGRERTEKHQPPPRCSTLTAFPIGRLLGSLSALILVWDSPALQGKILAKTGETLDQPGHQVLRHLLAWGPTRPSVLAAALGTGASNVSKIVGRLRQDGLDERTTDEADRRACLITLTTSGEKAVRGAYALGDRMIVEALEEWSLNDVRRYTALTDRA